VYRLCAAGVFRAAVTYGYAFKTSTKRFAARPVSAAGRHWLRTDHLGRDILTRLAFGGGSFLVSGTAVAAHVVIGLGLGIAAGFLGGRAGAVLMRVVDIALAFPAAVFLILILACPGRRVQHHGGLSLVGWRDGGRYVALTLRQREFVSAASAWRRRPDLRRHVCPTSHAGAGARVMDIGPVILSGHLSFLGMVSSPMRRGAVTDGFKRLRTYPQRLFRHWPCPARSSLTFVGEGVESPLDPRGGRWSVWRQPWN
jgi:ABC-type dipeptide/oligopeptide/nickel transport system permease subunit